MIIIVCVKNHKGNEQTRWTVLFNQVRNYKYFIAVCNIAEHRHISTFINHFGISGLNKKYPTVGVEYWTYTDCLPEISGI